MTKQTEHQDSRVDLYELGYLIVPTVAEEQLPDVINDIKKALSKHEAALVNEGAPALIDLSYQMIKAEAGANKRYDKAYFGWMTFNAKKSEAPALRKAFDSNLKILRNIFIKTEERIILPAKVVEEVLAVDAVADDVTEVPVVDAEDVVEGVVDEKSQTL